MTKAKENLMKKAAEMCNKKYESAKEWAELECYDNEKLEMHEWSQMNHFCAELFDMNCPEWIEFTCQFEYCPF